MALGYSYRIDPQSGDYVFEDGTFALDSTAQTPMVLALMDDRGAWWGGLDLGSEIRAILQGVPPADAPAALRDATLRALQGLVDQQRITALAVSVTETAPYVITVTATDGGTGNPIVVTHQP